MTRQLDLVLSLAFNNFNILQALLFNAASVGSERMTLPHLNALTNQATEDYKLLLMLWIFTIRIVCSQKISIWLSFFFTFKKRPYTYVPASPERLIKRHTEMMDSNTEIMRWRRLVFCIPDSWNWPSKFELPIRKLKKWDRREFYAYYY